MRTSVEVFPIALFDTFEPFAWGIRHGCVIPHSIMLSQGLVGYGARRREAHLVAHISGKQLIIVQVGWETTFRTVMGKMSFRTHTAGRISR